MNRYTIIGTVAVLVVLGVFGLSPSKQEQVWQPVPISETVTQFPVTAADAITEESETIETMEGYYAVRSGRGAEENPDYTYTCDVFVVKNEGPLIDYFLNLYNVVGNTVNRVDSDGNLVLNLYLNNLSAADISTVKNSDVQHMIKLEVQKMIQWGKGASPCSSFVTILKVEK